MKPMKLFLIVALVLPLLSGSVYAQQTSNVSDRFNAKQQSIVSISALTTKGDLIQLQDALTEGLNRGLTINEIKEVLVHLAAYVGFPRSLQGINTFIAVLEERK